MASSAVEIGAETDSSSLFLRSKEASRNAVTFSYSTEISSPTETWMFSTDSVVWAYISDCTARTEKSVVMMAEAASRTAIRMAMR